MSYVLSDSGNNVVAYPYSIGELRRDNPNVSFPSNPTEELLAEWFVFPVVSVTPPSFNRLSQDLTEIDPTYDSGTSTWLQTWQVTNVTPTIEAERTAQAELEVENYATSLLQGAEQYYFDAMIAGYGFSTDMENYITTLETPASIANYPLAEDMPWPDLPTNILDSNNPNLPVDIYTKTQADDKFIDTVELETILTDYATNAAIGGYVTQFNDAIALKADITYVDNTFVPQAGFTDAVLTAASGSYVPFSGGTMTGQLDMGFNSIVGLPDPTADDHAVNKLYVDSEIDNAIAGVATLPRLTINLETDTGSITTSPKIANALSTVGTTNGYTINLGFGEYRETGPIVFDNKWQLNVVGVHSANTTGATIKNGITIQNSNGVRLFKVQVEGTSNIACRAGLGQQFERSQFMGNVTLSGTGGFMMFTDCEFGGNVTVSADFAGVIYFTRCSFSNASGVYTFSNASAQQVVISDSTGLPNTQPARVSYFGNILSKNLVQKFYINNVALNPVGGTNGQVLQLISGTSTEWVPRNLTFTPWGQIGGDTTAGSKTLTGAASWNAVRTAFREIQLAVLTFSGHIFNISIPTALIEANRVIDAHHNAHGSDDEVSITFGPQTGATYTVTFTGSNIQAFYIYAR